MPDLLNALRRLYGEPGPEGNLPDGSEAEVRALAEIKASLDALPPRRPDAAVLDAVFAAAADPVPMPGDDPAEAAALAEVKAALDALPRHRPNAITLDAVFAAAAAPSARPAADRPARRLVTRRRVTILGAAFAFLLVVASGLWIRQDETTSPLATNTLQDEAAATANEREPAAEADEAVAGPEADAAPLRDAAPARSGGAPGRSAAPPPAEAPQPSASVAAAPEPTAQLARAASARSGQGEAAGDFALASELPLADGDDELRLLYLRMLEMQASQAGLGWDEPPVALGAELDSVPAASGWMQVRVER